MNHTFTAHTLIPNFTLANGLSFYDFCNDMGNLYGHIKRTLFKDVICSGKPTPALKNDYLKRFGITARQFNSIAFDLRGNIESARELLNRRILEAHGRIKSARKWIKRKQALLKKLSAVLALSEAKNDKDLANAEKINKIHNLKFAIHQKRRRLSSLKERFSRLKEDRKTGRIRICFGSKRLFAKQFNLTDNGYISHEEWLKDWRWHRGSTFMFIGSKDENAGNQTCTLSHDRTLRIRIPDCLQKEYGKYLSVPDIHYPYGDEIIGELHNKSAITHRFVRGDKGWYLHTSAEMPKPEPTTLRPRDAGCISVDVNEKEIAVSETDRSGNLVWHKTYPADVRDKTTKQAEAIYGDICKEIVSRAVLTSKSIGHESLDFTEKKSTLKESGRGYARMLSGLAYSTFLSMLNRRAYRNGVDIYTTNPAYTSVIGAYNHMTQQGISPHEAAALVIARRIQRYSESPSPARTAFPLPARNRGKHVWSFWRRLKDRGACNSYHRLYLRRSLQDSTAGGESTLPSSRTPPVHERQQGSV